ncbi:MAG TPA: hypothetical protein VF916_08180, partial [Ktedonobacterales bacterium]
MSVVEHPLLDRVVIHAKPFCGQCSLDLGNGCCAALIENSGYDIPLLFGALNVHTFADNHPVMP